MASKSSIKVENCMLTVLNQATDPVGAALFKYSLTTTIER